MFLKITNLQYMATLLLSSLMLSTASLRIREKLEEERKVKVVIKHLNEMLQGVSLVSWREYSRRLK